MNQQSLRSICLASVFIIVSSCTFGQNLVFNWVTQVGSTNSDFGESVVVGDQGEVVSVGTFFGTTDFDPGPNLFELTPIGGRDNYIQKLAADGSFLWAKSIGNSTHDLCYSVDLDDLGNVYVAGRFTGTMDFDPGTGVHTVTSQGTSGADIFLLKLDVNGDFVWVKTIGSTGGETPREVQLDDAGNIYLTGGFSSSLDVDPGPGVYTLTGTGSSDVFVLKLDVNGDFVWARSTNSSNFVEVESMDLDENLNVYLTGRFKTSCDFNPSSGGGAITTLGAYDVFVWRVNADGTFGWVKRLGGPLDDFGTSIVTNSLGDVYIGGSFEGAVDFDPSPVVESHLSSGDADVFIHKLDTAGNYNWTRNVGWTEWDGESQVLSNDLGDVYVSGIFQSTVDFDPGPGTFAITSLASTDVFFLKLDSIGEFVYATSFEGTANDQIKSFAKGVNDDFLLTGSFKDDLDGDPGTGTSLISTTVNWWIEDAFLIKLSECFPNTGTAIVEECYNYTSPSGNYTWTSTGQYLDTIPNALGCDSVITIDLTITNATALGTDVQVVCDSITWIDGNTYYADTVGASFTILGGAANGCDSIVTLDLVVNLPSVGSDVHVVCDSLNWIDGNTYFADSVGAQFIIPGGAANGCDSIVELDVTVNTAQNGVDVVAACSPFVWIDGNTYSQDNSSATHVIANGSNNGCDSIVTLNLTVDNPTGVDSVESCDAYTWIDGVTYSSSNTSATFLIPNGAANGCDSVVALNLIIHELDITTQDDGLSEASSNATGVEYQWLDCNDDFSAIVGETNQSIIFDHGGSYAVQISSNGCVDTSACIDLFVGIDEIDFPEISIYPNPSSGSIKIETENSLEEGMILVRSILGQTVLAQKIYKETIIELKEAGVYLIEIFEEHHLRLRKRVVIE